MSRGLVGTPRRKRAGVYGALRPRGGQRRSSEEGAMAAAARRPVCCARQPFLGRSDGGEGRATMLSYAPSHLIVRSLGNKCLLPARAQRPRLNNPTRLLYSNLAAFSCFRGPGTPPAPRDDVAPGSHPPAPASGSPSVRPVTSCPGVRKRHSCRRRRIETAKGCGVRDSAGHSAPVSA